MPAVVVAVALTVMTSMRDPFVPAAKTETIVPVPSRAEFATDICPTLLRGALA
jgi:hypothetical protein